MRKANEKRVKRAVGNLFQSQAAVRFGPALCYALLKICTTRCRLIKRALPLCLIEGDQRFIGHSHR